MLKIKLNHNGPAVTALAKLLFMACETKGDQFSVPILVESVVVLEIGLEIILKEV